ncbi:hypothetical protein HAX54_037185 [Datura stramonium]|uniref:Uncharacterized protein n=1 Tax=Datura stramonium TaxID=4076 RepID=A0ABS8SH57_DATST|nr:hypothetical protein [Datura stramonium]
MEWLRVMEHCLRDTEVTRRHTGNHQKSSLGIPLPRWQHVTLLGQRARWPWSRSLPAVACFQRGGGLFRAACLLWHATDHCLLHRGSDDKVDDRQPRDRLSPVVSWSGLSPK